MLASDKIAAAFGRDVYTTDSSSLIVRYYQGIRAASARIAGPTALGFMPDFAYPELTSAWERFFEVAAASWNPLGSYRGKDLVLLDLMKNPGTGTTKTVASLLMVARAVHHIRMTGERILIFTPSSGNKAVALRDAVARALDFGLADEDQLRIVTMTPTATSYKLRRNLLTDVDGLRRKNPILLYSGARPDDVKQLGQTLVREVQARCRERWRIWYALDIANYKVADACRAFFEYEFGRGTGRRVHAHAVSSAYGLLGYQHGLDVLESLGLPVRRPGFLLVQHLATSDMVEHYLREGLGLDPAVYYERDPATGLLAQAGSPYFPQTTWSERENLEPTFYTNAPPTSAEMTRLMMLRGGSAIVVSLHECLLRYGQVRRWLGETDCRLPEDPRSLAEWSVVMGLTGVFNAIDRGLVNDFDDVVLHGSGMYLYPTDQALDARYAIAVDGLQDALAAVLTD